MPIQDLFRTHPFQNLIVASSDAASFELRGHEEQFRERMNDIREAVRRPGYDPAEVQHTIVFGEWGHGKTHLLRRLGTQVNTELADFARAFYYYPTTVDPAELLPQLSHLFDLDTGDASEFVWALKEPRFPPHILLLIDESQTLVGEDVEATLQEEALSSYYAVLDAVLAEAAAQHCNLHIFHAFSINSARAVDRMAEIPLVQKLRKWIFTLNSLDESDQWQMIADHIAATLKPSVRLQPREIVDRGVNRCINKLTGGNPRWALMLMNELYLEAANSETIDADVCLRALRDRARIDNPRQAYFDRYLIDMAMSRLRSGRILEQVIARLFDTYQAELLGAWGSVDQEALDSLGLRSADVRIRCPHIDNHSVFGQTEEGDFELTQEFRELIGVRSPGTIVTRERRETLLSLSLEPETLLRDLSEGLRSLLHFVDYSTSAEARVGDPKVDVVYFDVAVPDGSTTVRVGAVIYKGHEIPLEVYREVASRIGDGRCALAVFIEDTRRRSDVAGSTYERFMDSYAGPVNITQRFLFIRGESETGFDEDFFPSLIYASKGSKENAASLFQRMRIGPELQRLLQGQDAVYCPAEPERELVSHLMSTENAYTLAELKARDPSFAWVNKERLASLGDYLLKDGTRYRGRLVEQVPAFRVMLRVLQESEEGMTPERLQAEVHRRCILTGKTEPREHFVRWATAVLEVKGTVARRQGLIYYRDVAAEVRTLRARYNSLHDQIQTMLESFLNVGIVASRMEHSKQRLADIDQRVANVPVEGLLSRDTLEHGIADLESVLAELGLVPGAVRPELLAEASSVEAILSDLQGKLEWPYGSTPDPLRPYMAPFPEELQRIRRAIALDPPTESATRERIRSLRTQLAVLLEQLAEDGSREQTVEAEGEALGETKFRLYAAAAARRKGEATLHFYRTPSDQGNGDTQQSETEQ
jgi:hypothetical protein